MPFQLGEQTYFLDFSLRDGEIGVLNADFLDQHVFFLDYKRRRLEGLEWQNEPLGCLIFRKKQAFMVLF